MIWWYDYFQINNQTSVVTYMVIDGDYNPSNANGTQLSFEKNFKHFFKTVQFFKILRRRNMSTEQLTFDDYYRKIVVVH